MPLSLSLQVAGLDVPCEGTLGCVASVVLGEMKLGSLTSWSAWFHRGCMEGDLAPRGIPKPRIPGRTVTFHLLLLAARCSYELRSAPVHKLCSLR